MPPTLETVTVSAASFAEEGGGQAWSGAADVLNASDAAYLVNTFSPGVDASPTTTVIVTPATFGLTGAEAIRGLELLIERLAVNTGTPTTNFRDDLISMRIDTDDGEDKSAGADWAAVEAVTTFGSPSDDWGMGAFHGELGASEVILASDVDDLRALIRGVSGDGTLSIGTMDHVQLRLSYHEPDANLDDTDPFAVALFRQGAAIQLPLNDATTATNDPADNVGTTYTDDDSDAWVYVGGPSLVPSIMPCSPDGDTAVHIDATSKFVQCTNFDDGDNTAQCGGNNPRAYVFPIWLDSGSAYDGDPTGRGLAMFGRHFFTANQHLGIRLVGSDTLGYEVHVSWNGQTVASITSDVVQSVERIPVDQFALLGVQYNGAGLIEIIINGAKATLSGSQPASLDTHAGSTAQVLGRFAISGFASSKHLAGKFKMPAIFPRALTDQEWADLWTIATTPGAGGGNPPIANDDSYTLPQVGIHLLRIFENDVGVDAPIDYSSIVITTPPTHGDFLPTTYGGFYYKTTTMNQLTDSFQYTVDDIKGQTSDPATVTINFRQPPDDQSTSPQLRNRPHSEDRRRSDFNWRA